MVSVNATAAARKQPKGIQSVENAARILEAFAAAGGLLRLVDLAGAAKMTRSMCHGYLVSLQRVGLVQQDADSGNYGLGPAALRMGLTALAQVDFVKLARGALQDLAEATGETTAVAVWSPDGPTVVAKVESPATSMYEIRIGAHANLVTTATGRIFLAWLPPSSWEALLARTRVKGGRMATLADVRAAIKGVREQGYAQIEVTPGMPELAGAAAPVFGHDGGLRGALVVVERVRAGGGARRKAIAADLLRVSSELSRNLGFELSAGA
jgi:DNA-binding IclR family transcriptional regulator